MAEHATDKPEIPKQFACAAMRLDARGMLCPEPVVLCREAMERLSEGQTIHVMATDPHAEIDFRVFARRFGHRIEVQCRRNDLYHFLIRKAAPAG